MPLVAWGYLAFVAGLLAGFGGIALVAALVAIAGIGSSLLRRSITLAALSAMLLGGTLAALSAGKPERARRFHPADSVSTTRLGAARATATRAIDSLFGTDAPMARALLVADQHEIPPEVRDRYARAGMVHMLSISGLHVAIIAAAVILMLRLARISPVPASLAAMLLTAFYVAVIGAPAPAVRSAVMLGVVSSSRALQRPTSPWASLALGGFVPLLDPRTVLDLGYQLSVLGIAGLIGSAALAKRLIGGRFSGVRALLVRDVSASIVATLLTAPVIAWYFGRVSLVAPLANLIATPVVAVLQPTLFLALLLAPIPALGQFVADAALPLLQAFDGIARLASSLPGASVAVIPSLVTVLAGGALVAALLVACLSRYPVRPVSFAAASLAIVAWSPALRLPHSGEMEMHVLDVGQGDAILIRTDRGRWLIIDAGRAWRSGDAGRSTVIPYVMRRGGDVIAFVLSHAHSDHAGGAETVLRSLRPKFFWDAAFPQGSEVYQQTLAAARASGVGWHRVHPGDALPADGVTLRFLAPDSSWMSELADPNDASAIALVEFGSTRFLLMGDAESAEESWLMRNAAGDLRADVLKVGHHGSSTSSTDGFLTAV
ncbi:MAG: DNA internalization-related competence protein ComEC/Rec2, partial [Gemmatimonadaceae bacterium]|nr:DNA internalization-related competence protein ComEC/Rec2 [Gemmatimonadaceae bacterium]